MAETTDSKSNSNSTNKNAATSVLARNNGTGKEIKSIIPREREKVLKWNGWGYNDSKFAVTNDFMIYFSGDRYPIGNLLLPYFKQWVQQIFNLDFTSRRVPKPLPTVYPDPILSDTFINDIKAGNILFSVKGVDRLIRSHGQTLYEIHNLREGIIKRIPDVVVWPQSHDDVVTIVNAANSRNVTIIPFGGGTSVSGSVTCPQNEQRSIVALDTSQMNRMLWLDRPNMTACFEAGIIGQDLERELKAIGLTVGHEPDSYEFSSLGGWVATRASGMKKNVYGNIEDLVVQLKMVTTKGVLERKCLAPRLSCGPDFNQIILGSEGTLGVITEVVLKVSKMPTVRAYGSLIFPYFDCGVKCLREVAARKCQPSSIRLIDNDQFKFGQALKPKATLFGSVIEGMKRAYITKLKGFDLNKMCVATLLFEGDEKDVKRQQKLINEIADKYGGLPAGAVNGERGYVLTFVIAYIRDLALEFYIVAESFETSVPWDKCAQLCRNTKLRVSKECQKLGVKYYLISCRVTQTYDAGACVYFYFGFNYSEIKDPVETYEHIESVARMEILLNGGSISHHHGVGKLRSRWYPQSVSSVGVGLYKSAKQELDPKNIFAAGNLLPNPNDVEHKLEHNKLQSKL